MIDAATMKAELTRMWREGGCRSINHRTLWGLRSADDPRGCIAFRDADQVVCYRPGKRSNLRRKPYRNKLVRKKELT